MGWENQLTSPQQQLYPAKNPCTKCGGPISWDKTMREYLKTNLPLNLDRTIHDRASCDYFLSSSATITESLTKNLRGGIKQGDTEAVKEAKITSALRTEEIAKGHKENMESAELSRQSIDNLTKAINRLADVWIGNNPSGAIAELTTAIKEKKGDSDLP
jgi:hypothetical protein